MDLETHHIFISRNVVFHETVFPLSQQSPSSFPSASSPTDLSSSFLPQNNTSHTDSPQSILPQHNTTQTVPHQSISGRIIKTPSHLSDYICNSVVSSSKYPISSYFSLDKLSEPYQKFIILLSILTEPTSYKQASQHPEWVLAMQEELQALVRTDTWLITTLPPGKVPISCKWVYKIKFKADATVERYKARLVAKGLQG